MLNTLRGDVYIVHSLGIKEKVHLTLKCTFWYVQGKDFYAVNPEDSQEKEVTLGLSKLPSPFPKGWAGQAESEQECQVSESGSFGAGRWKGNWWITEITSPAHFLCRAGPWLFPPKFWNASRMVIPIPQWLWDGVSSHSGPLLEKCFLIPNPKFCGWSGSKVIILSLFVGTWTSPAPPGPLL